MVPEHPLYINCSYVDVLQKSCVLYQTRIVALGDVLPFQVCRSSIRPIRILHTQNGII